MQTKRKANRRRSSFLSRRGRLVGQPLDRRLRIEPLEDRRLLAVVTVGNDLDLANGNTSSIASLIADDGGDGISLREALAAANSNPGTDTITFALSGQVITPGSALPMIIDSVVIDATTAPGYAGEPLVTLDGFGAGTAAGLHLSASAPNSEIHGLSIIRFTDGIILESNDNLVSQNYVGIGPSGGIGGGNAFDGVMIDDASGNLITQNIISGNFRYGLFISEGGSNIVTGNQIGTDIAGLMAEGNTSDGIQIANSSNNQIGGIVDADRNIISGNLNGITIIGDFAPASLNLVQGNYIGTDVTGLLPIPNLFDGIQLWNVTGAANGAVTGNLIGGDDDDDGALDGVVHARNVISGNLEEGIALFGIEVTQNHVEGNWIGLTADGQTALPNRIGVNITKSIGAPASEAAFSNTIGGISAGAGNVISGNSRDGIQIAFGSFSNIVLGNFIGTDISGGADPNAPINLGNSRDGIHISDATDNLIGGVTVAERNIIAGNLNHGVAIKPGDLDLPTVRNQVQGNYIGVLIDGVTGHGNIFDGVYIEEASDNIIGGTAVGAGNVISGNGKAGVEIGGAGSTSNLVQGNFIGTTADGSAALQNEFGVVILDSASENIIGGDSTIFRNVISGNDQAGVLITGMGTDDNIVQWNAIGTNSEESDAIANNDGILIENGASNNLIGGIGKGNVISGNSSVGIFLDGASTTDNKIKGNYIGASTTGFAIANGYHGIFIGNANDTKIGGPDIEDGADDGVIEAGNVIAFNGTSLGLRGHGVVVESGTGNEIRGNSIYENEGRGIDLGNDSFTLNDGFGTAIAPAPDEPDTDTGANNLQNTAFVASVIFDFENSEKAIVWELHSTPNLPYTFEVFSNDDLDPSGFGEGQTYVASYVKVANRDGVAKISETVPLDTTWIAVTVTDVSGNTSEFSIVDTDGDAIADAWETPGLGIDFDEDGTIDLELWEKGARPDKKDVLVEIDAMNGFAPSNDVLNWVKNGRPEMSDEGFANAPADLVQNPDDSAGINLILELDETITASPWTGDANGNGQTAADGDTADYDGFPFFNKTKANTSPSVSGGFGTQDERNFPETIAAKRLVYHYAIFADQFVTSVPGGGTNNTTTGIAEISGNDVIVSLGTRDNNGTSEERAGTFMHELGHNLGLYHGGFNDVNYKPNYHSVLNYTWQSPKKGYELSWRLDYSREQRADLNEADLNETAGLGGNPAFLVPIGPIKDDMGITIPELPINEGGSFDFNGTPETPSQRDLNYIYGGVSSPGQTLVGHDDWSALTFNFRNATSYADGVQSDNPPDEITLDIDLGLDSIGIGPGAIQFTHSQFEVDESGAFAEIRVVRAGGKDGEVSVDYDFVSGTATDGQDFTALSGTLTFPHAEFSQIIQIPILGDLLSENDETVSLTLSNPTNGAVLGDRATSQLTIVDDDKAGQLQFLSSSYVANEISGALNVVVERFGGTQGAITVDFELEDGTALSTHDYVYDSGTLAFADGEDSQIIVVQISDDQLGEGSEYFNVTLSNPTGGASLGDPSTTAITIGDNETPIVVINTSNSGFGSLREAIQIANGRAGVDAISFHQGIFSTPQTISLSSSELEITEAVTINGPGQQLLTVIAGNESRIFHITATTGDFILAGLSITGGEKTGQFDSGKGGAIRSDTDGSLTIERSTISGSSTTGQESQGGGIFSYGDLTLINSTVSGNSTAGTNAEGGGIYSRGDVTLIGSTVSGNSTAGFGAEGGGIYSRGDMTLISSTISGNSTAGQSADGGGINSDGYMTLIDSTVSGNSTTGQFAEGGGIYSYLDLTLTGSTVSGNSTTGDTARGGGIYSYYNVALTDSTVSGNSTAGKFFADGGGIHANKNVTLIRSTVSGNRTTSQIAFLYGSNGGGISSHVNGDYTVTLIDSTVSGNSTAGSEADGGGIIAFNVTLTGSTISGNSTAGELAEGGGIYAFGDVTLTQSTVTDNHADHATATGGGIWIYDDSIAITGSIVAGNTAGGGMSDINPGTGSLQANFSLIEQTGLTITGGDNIIGQSANLGPLANNGGPTQTHALLPGSPAIDIQVVSTQEPPFVHEYVLNNSLSDALGGPALVDLGGVLTAGGYQFGPNQGLNLSGTINSSAEYTIELLFSFDALSGYQKIIDFADLGSDLGLYTYDGELVFYDAAETTDSNLFSPGTQHQLVLSRDDTTDMVRAYVDGNEAFNFVDSSGIAAFGDPSQIMRFFQDDNVSGNTETGSGFVDRIRIYDQVWNVTTGFDQFDQRGDPFQRVAGNGVDSGAYELQVVVDSADFDGDLDIDGFDFLAWQRGFGTQTPNATKADGDADDDQDVDGVDLTVWGSQFGTGSASLVAAASTAIEPVIASSLESETDDLTPEPLSADLVDAAIALDQTLRSKSGSRFGSYARFREGHVDWLSRSVRWSQQPIWQGTSELANHSFHSQSSKANEGRFYRDPDAVDEELLDKLFAEDELAELL
jgi:parallel beta-helix repeat protein